MELYIHISLLFSELKLFTNLAESNDPFKF